LAGNRQSYLTYESLGSSPPRPAVRYMRNVIAGLENRRKRKE
jgi:hypothetical protein